MKDDRCAITVCVGGVSILLVISVYVFFPSHPQFRPKEKKKKIKTTEKKRNRKEKCEKDYENKPGIECLEMQIEKVFDICAPLHCTVPQRSILTRMLFHSRVNRWKPSQ